MAEEAKISKLAIARKNTVKFFYEIRSELKRVIWPTKEQLINNTITVLLACLIIGIIIWLADAVFASIFKLVFAS